MGLTKESYLIDAAAAAALLVFGQVVSESIGDKKDFHCLARRLGTPQLPK